jgi:hypothetical protein
MHPGLLLQAFFRLKASVHRTAPPGSGAHSSRAPKAQDYRQQAQQQEVFVPPGADHAAPLKGNIGEHSSERC